MWTISESSELKLANREFEHCGIIRQQSSDYSVVTHQNHYAQTLNPINTVNLNLNKPEVALSADYHSLYLSLLGGLAWLNQTRLDTCVFTCSLQRAAAAPTIGPVSYTHLTLPTNREV